MTNVNLWAYDLTDEPHLFARLCDKNLRLFYTIYPQIWETMTPCSPMVESLSPPWPHPDLRADLQSLLDAAGVKLPSLLPLNDGQSSHQK